MYDPRNKLTSEVNGQLFNYFGDAVYRTVVPRNIRLAEAPSYGKPVIKYDRKSGEPSPIWLWLEKCCAAMTSRPG